MKIARLFSALLTLCLLLTVFSSCNRIFSSFDTDSESSDSKDDTDVYPDASEGLEFKVYSNGTCSVTGVGTCTDSNIVIPQTAPSGEVVTRIASNAFIDCESLISITMPNSITAIETSAFENCKNLKTVNFSNNLASIGNYSFRNCNSLSNINLPDSLNAIESYAFEHCIKLSEINLPKNIIAIDSGAFKDCSNLTGLNVPNGITVIGDYTFSGCSQLTNITIPCSVNEIGKYAFENCSDLTEIDIPNSVTNVARYAFNGCSKIIEIENGVSYVDNWVIDCNDSVKSIELRSNTVGICDYAFPQSLNDVTIPKSVSYISASAFWKCAFLKTIYYTGNEQDWASISIGTSDNTSSRNFNNAKKVFNYIPKE